MSFEKEPSKTIETNLESISLMNKEGKILRYGIIIYNHNKYIK